MFSVIIPVYNKEKYIAKAIESVLSQEYENYEVIIVNDSSTDRSKEIIHAYQSEKIRVIERKEPGPGGYAARNLGVYHAKYEWITFLDADDYWYKNHLLSAKEEIEKHTCVNLFCFSRDKIKQGEKRSFIQPAEGLVSNSEAIRYYADKDIFHTNAVVVRKSLFIDSGGFPEGKCKRGGDSDLWLRLLLRCDKICLSKKITSCYVIDNSGVIYGKASVDSIHPVYLSIKSYLRENPKSSMAHDLKKLANRKNLSWAQARKRNGNFRLRELGTFFFRSLTYKAWYKIAGFLLPNALAEMSLLFKNQKKDYL